MADRPPAMPGCKACTSRIRRYDGSIIHADDCPLDAPVYLALVDAFHSLDQLEREVTRAKKDAAEALVAYREAAADDGRTEP